MNGRCGEAREFRDVTAHVVAIVIESGRLAEGVQHPAGARVVARSGYPLPVACVAGHVAIGQQLTEVPVPVPPVDAQRPGEERGGDHPGPVMHEPFGDELPHADVDHRDAGVASPPRLQRVLVFGPVPGAVGARMVILRGDVRERGRDLVEEITPGQLPAELFSARPRQRGPC